MTYRKLVIGLLIIAGCGEEAQTSTNCENWVNDGAVLADVDLVGPWEVVDDGDPIKYGMFVLLADGTMASPNVSDDGRYKCESRPEPYGSWARVSTNRVRVGTTEYDIWLQGHMVLLGGSVKLQCSDWCLPEE